MNRKAYFQRMTRRSFAVLLVHTVAAFCSYVLAFVLLVSSGFTSPEHAKMIWPMLWLTMPAVLVVKAIVFYASGLCHRSWQYINFSDLAALVRTGTLASLILATLDHFGDRLVGRKVYHVPFSIFIIDWAMTLLILGSIRAALRFTREEFKPLIYGYTARKCLIVGANQSGETLARHLLVDRHLNFRVVGYLDPNRALQGTELGGVPVFGNWEDAPYYAEGLGVDDILVLSDVLSVKELLGLMVSCKKAELNLKVIPAMDDLFNSNYSPRVRDVEINDLLRREPVKLNDDAIRKLVEGRVVMVTGAGGSIGSEICRQVLRFEPKKLLLVERAENSLFFVEQEFVRGEFAATIVPCIADICDETRIRQLFATHRPDVVFHAAAHKHVPMMENNPGEAVKNNVLGTKRLAELAEESGVNEFVMISTDKAVNPTSVMGVSKHLAERFIHAFSESAKTKFVVVRFGNVLASNGSVVPIFQEQIRRGGPITVTHPDIERYFMTIPEASQLVLQAAAMGKGGEIFVLDMGESMRIVDLAHDLIRLSGLAEDDIEIVFTGLRPGEKLYEELYFDEEEMQPTPHNKVFVAFHRPFKLDEVSASLMALGVSMHATPDELRQKLKELVPEYLTTGSPTTATTHKRPGKPASNGPTNEPLASPVAATVPRR